MSETGQYPSAEEAFGPRPGAAGPSGGGFPTAEEAFGPRGSEPQQQPVFWKGAFDFGAAAMADLTRPGAQSGSSTPALDNYFDNTPAGHVMKAFGQDAQAPFHGLAEMTDPDNGAAIKFLKNAGVYKAWDANHSSTADFFRNSTLRPLAQAATQSTDLVNQTVVTPAARAVLGAAHEVTQLPGQIGYGAGIADAFGQLRRDLINDPEDVSGLKGKPLEATMLPYLHKFIGQAGVEGKVAVELFDTANLAFSLLGIPQLINKGNEEVATAAIKARNGVVGPPTTGEPEQQQIQELTQKLGFYEMFAMPEKGGGTAMAARLSAARDAGVLKPPPPPDGVAASIKQTEAANAAQLKETNSEPPERPAGTPKADLDVAPAPVAAAAPVVPAADVHTVARQIAPDTFTKYDPLAAKHAWYVDWISELRQARNSDPRLQAAQGEIDRILAKVGGVESRLTGRARAQVEDIRGGMQDFLAVDTPDMVKVKQAMAQNYRDMADLTPEVQRAYRMAGDRMAQEAAGRGEPSPVETVTRTPVQAPAAPVPEPGVAAPRAGLPPETAHIQTTADVANDISRQLQAAGRPKEEADLAGQLRASAYEARAERFGGTRGTAAELYRAEGPTIQGPNRRVAGQRTFAQAGQDLEDVINRPDTDAINEPVENVRENSTLNQPNRGAITFRPDAGPIIRLMDADPSTFIHETGHHLLEELMTDAVHLEAPPDLKQDADTARAWLNIKPGEAIPRKAHEQWARGFERYLLEGIAPNRELANVFAKFKQWLIRIYQTAAKLRAPINDDIRAVFDRLVATPDQAVIIAKARGTTRMMADMHEVEARTTEPRYAGETADHIDREVQRQLRRGAPEEHDALRQSEGQGGPISGAGTRPAGGPNEARPGARQVGHAQAPGAVPAGGDAVAPAGADVRPEPDEGSGPASGGVGAGGEQPAGAENAGSGPGRGGLDYIEGTGPLADTQFARTVEARAVAAGMPPDFFGDIPQHATMNFTDQATWAVNVLHDDPAYAKEIAMRTAEPPKGLLPEFVAKAVENEAIAHKDWETVRQLGVESGLVKERTMLARRLAAFAEHDPTDPVAAIRTVVKAREAKAQINAGAVIKEGRTALRKSVSPKNVWADLITEWTCK